MPSSKRFTSIRIRFTDFHVCIPVTNCPCLAIFRCKYDKFLFPISWLTLSDSSRGIYLGRLTHFFFLSIFFFLPIALAFLEGLPTFDPYVPFPYGIIFPFVKRPLMYLVHCQEQFLADQLLRSFVAFASFRVDQHMSEVFLRSSRPLASFAVHRSLALRVFL